MASTHAPPPAIVGDRAVVAVDVTRIDARLTFDVATARAVATAAVDFVADATGRPALDLRQRPGRVVLDGRRLDAGAWAPVDLGGGPGADMRVLDAVVESGSRHRLEVDYDLTTPAAVGAEPIGWEADGVRFDLWMSDLEPGRYLEMWIPAPLCHDRFELRVEVAVTGTGRPHTIVTNAGDGCVATGPNRWTVAYPGTFTSLSPMLVVAPSDAVEVRSSAVSVVGRPPLRLRCVRHLEVDADLAACEADVASWLAHLSVRYGPWAHGGDFTAFVWGPGRGMEYDGATTASVPALEHEVFHSWFGRGVKPARASDGWIDEAWTSWATTTRATSAPGAPGRFAEVALGLDDEPVLLYPPHPWSRFTPRAAYTDGARLFAGLAERLGGADRLRSAMAAWYATNVGALVTTDGLRSHLSTWSGIDLGPWWDRYVHGRA